MAAYRRVYDKRHLQADCQELGSAHSWSYDSKFSHVKTPPLPAIYPVSKITMGSLVITVLLPLAVWPRGVKCSELKGYAFESRPFCFQAIILGKLSAYKCLSQQVVSLGTSHTAAVLCSWKDSQKSKDVREPLHPIMLATTQDRTLIDHGLQKRRFVYVFREYKYYNKGW